LPLETVPCTTPDERRSLPIYALEPALVGALAAEERCRVVLQAPTGSGKSTQVPQIVLDHGLAGEGEIIVLQPRRLATRLLARRVAHERGGRPGEEVGYQIRLEKVASARTRIRFVTEGVLLRRMLHDPGLRGVAAILFDEFHERHLYGDLTLARALDLQETRRPDLKLVVMSATLDTAALERYLAPCRVLASEGRTFPVEIRYAPRGSGVNETPVWDAAAAAAQAAAPETEGDLLIFMPGAYEIGRTLRALEDRRLDRQFALFALHGELPPARQDVALARSERRKIIVATNVAETSLTIEGVRVVIDSGLARIARFDPYRGINTLLVEKISQASADQRAGRAGRTAPGICLRLWSEREQSQRPAQELPEVRRLDLAEVVLTLKAGGVEEIRAFRWLEPPDPKALERSEALLCDLGALSAPGREGRVTPVGERMLAFPVHPRHARMLLAAEAFGCVREAAWVAALTQGRPIFRRGGPDLEEARERLLGPPGGSDLLRLIRAMELSHGQSGAAEALGLNPGAAREAAQLFGQFAQIAEREGLPLNDRAAGPEAVARCLLAGFPDQVAHRLDAGTLRCAMVHGRKGVLARESVVQKEPLLVVGEVREVSGKGGVQTLFSQVTAIEEAWLRDGFPEAFHAEESFFYDPTLRRVMLRRETRFHDLVLASGVSDKVPPEVAASVLAREVAAGRIPLNKWDHAVEQWILRLNRLREWMPELGLPALEEEDRLALFEQICYGAATFRELKERAVWPVVKSWLSPEQAGWLDRYAPERLAMPNGRSFKLIYDASGSPVISVRIQDLYGVEEQLVIAAGRVPVTIQVLAPNHRPVQVTQHLATFWREAYPKLREELKRRYPKHLWK